MANYDKLMVWQRAMDLAEFIYELTRGFPQSEVFGLTAQMRRSAVSVPSNVAEGHGRESKADFARFLAIARGSLSELETQVILAGRIGYLDDAQLQLALRLTGEVESLIRGLRNALQRAEIRES